MAWYRFTTTSRRWRHLTLARVQRAIPALCSTSMPDSVRVPLIGVDLRKVGRVMAVSPGDSLPWKLRKEEETTMSTQPHRHLGKYELQERLGQGGMAEVWKAYDTQLK